MNPDILNTRHDRQDVTARTGAIHQAMLRDSPALREANFQVVGPEDLAHLFRLYDQQFFGGELTRAVTEEADGPLTFRLSSRMTWAGARTIRTRVRQPRGGSKTFYEIAVASRLLLFDESQSPAQVCGLVCHDRLQALQRLMEHEILHLAELLVWDHSSCSAARFKALAGNLFGHLDTKHKLITPQARAAITKGIRVGSPVEFVFDGKALAGWVNRIHQRATVLVQAHDGRRYSDGKRYHKYYVPLASLRPTEAPSCVGR